MYSAEQERSKRFDELAEDYKDNYLPELSPYYTEKLQYYS